MMKSVERW